MTRKRPERNRDLAGLLSGAADLTRPNSTTTLPVTALRSSKSQPRRTFDDASLASLAESIREQGVLQPLLVRPLGEGHEIVAGERRWRAAQLAGLTEVPVVVRDLTDREARAAALVENLQRENLGVIDEVDGKLDLVALALDLTREEARARLMQLLREERGPDHETLTALFTPLGESWENFAKNKLRVLNWPPAVLEALRGGLPRTLAAMIVAAPEEHHTRLIEQARGGLSRVELQAEVDRLKVALPAADTLDRVTRISKHLGSRRTLTRLNDRQLKRLEQWLEKMPADLRELLEGKG